MSPWPYPRLFAHRGGGKLAPENTLAAIRTGQALGYRAVEFDVNLTGDGVAILLHDETLDRTTSGNGAVATRSWHELERLDAGAWFSEAFRGESIARFDETARHLVEGRMMANVEIKPSPGREEETGRIVAAATAALWPTDAVPPLLSSFSFEALLSARQAAPHLPCGWLTEEPTAEDFGRMDRVGAVSLHFSDAFATRDLVDRIHGTGRRVMIWTVDDPSRAQELLDWGVDGIFTDNLAEFASRFPALR
jgi:glycerophosphoryl diester phosphodiesterase